VILSGSEAGDAGFELFYRGNPGKPRILVFTEYVNATYFISFDTPMRAMHERGEIEFAVASQAAVAKLGDRCWARMDEAFQPDCVVLTRYAQPFGVEILQYFRARGTPVVYHIDDDLLEIPDSLGHDIVKRNGSSVVKEARWRMLAGADLVYASTSMLAARLESKFPGQRIFHGMYAPYLGDRIAAPRPRPGRGTTVGYMGSKGHQHDLAIAVPDLVQLMESRPDLRFETFGTISMPDALKAFGQRITAHAVNKSYVAFLGALAGLGWDVGLAPLADEPFNRCKAPTKYVEYSAAGIPVVASDVNVYREVVSNGGGMLVNGDWNGAIARYLDDADLRATTASAARAWCGATFPPARLEAQLREVLSLVAPPTR
jgi:glycosyltransferase involved in cell wall biosynthesis